MDNENRRERVATTLRKNQLLENVSIYVDAHLDERITLRQIADHFHVSVSTVTQLFQKRTGTTFHQFLTERRMLEAEKLIRRGIPLEEVGKRVGYRDHSSFYRAFRQTYGMSPRDFKQGNKE